MKWDNKPSINPEKWSVPAAYNQFSKGFQKSVETTFSKEIAAGKTLLPDLLRANVSRFAAAKAIACDRLIAQDAAKEPDRQTGVEKMIQTFDYWQQTEENTARTRARSAKQWQDFTDGDRAELFPNVRWMRSISLNKRPDHEELAGRVFSKFDPFIQDNPPGSEWNCKCDMQETSQPVTEGNADVSYTPPARGLEGNPALTGEVFTDRAKYYSLSKGTRQIEGIANSEYLFRDNKQWRLDYYTDSAGVLAVERERIAQATTSKNAKSIFDKEINQCQTLAHDGNITEFISEVQGRYDCLLNTQKCELKQLSSGNNLMKEVKDAFRNKGAELVVVEFLKMDGKIIHELSKVKNEGFNVWYYLTSDKTVIYK